MTTTENISTEINTPTQRLSDKEIYDIIYTNVKMQVDGMLGKINPLDQVRIFGSDISFNFARSFSYTIDVMQVPPTFHLLKPLSEKSKIEFLDFIKDFDSPYKEEMTANYSRYQKIYNKNYKKMIKDAGFTREVYKKRKAIAIKWYKAHMKHKHNFWKYTTTKIVPIPKEIALARKEAADNDSNGSGA